MRTCRSGLVLSSSLPCDTTWFRASGGQLQARSAAVNVCAGEASAFNARGSDILRSVYSNTPFELTLRDVPNDELGLVADFRKLCSFKTAPSDEVETTLPLAGTNVFNKAGATLFPLVGVLYSASVELAGAAAPQALSLSLQAVIDGVATGNPQTTRNVTLKFLQASPLIEVFLPLAKPNFGTNDWCPVFGFADNTVPTRLVVNGALGTGLATVRWVGPSSSELTSVIGAMSNVA